MPAHPWDAITIGAGLGALTAAAYLAKAGKRVLVLDRNRAPGGAAASYTRQGRRFEVSPHAIVPPDAPGDPKGAIFEALGLHDRLELVPIPAFQEIRGAQFGGPVALPHGLDAIETTLSARFPDQAPALSAFLDHVRLTQAAVAQMSLSQDGRWWQAAPDALPAPMRALLGDISHSLAEVLERFFGDHERIKLLLAANLPCYADDPARFWWLGYATAHGGYLAHGGCYIKGGSSALARALAEIILENGGDLRLQAEATRLLTRGARVLGVEWRAQDDRLQTARAPVVIAGIAPDAVTRLLRAPQSDAIAKTYADKRASVSLFEITFALTTHGADLGITAYSTVLMPSWMTRLSDFSNTGILVGTRPGKLAPPLVVIDYGQIDAGLNDRLPAPITVTGIDNIDNWRGLGDQAYEARKSDWIAAITGHLDAEWPGFAASVMRADMATARTMQDWLGTPEGAVFGYAPDVPAQGGMAAALEVTTPLDGLYLASAFAGVGGYSGAMAAGQMAAAKALAQLS